jgi:thiol-disulfide isomerase/thioredoxin
LISQENRNSNLFPIIIELNKLNLKTKKMKTKKSILISLSFCCLVNTGLISAKEKPNFTLSGKIIGQQTGQIVLGYVKGNKYTQDTVIINNGNFKFTGTIQEPTFARLSIIQNSIWIEPTQMNLKVDVKNIDKYILSGSKTQLEQNEYDKEARKIFEKINFYKEAAMKIYDSIENCRDTIRIGNMSAEYERLDGLRALEDSKLPELDVQFIRSHPNSFISGGLLSVLNKREDISLDTTIALYNQLGEIVQNGSSGKTIQTDIKKMKNNQVGSIAPDFEANDELHNSTVKLTEFIGNVVLLDFWAHSCGPCRKGFKYLKPLYNRLNNKGFEIIAINVDPRQDMTAWKKAIEKDSVSMWHHVQVAENFSPKTITEKDIYSKYYVQSIPRKILIDKKGIIVGNWVGAGEQTEEEVAKKIQELFNQ